MISGNLDLGYVISGIHQNRFFIRPENVKIGKINVKIGKIKVLQK